MFDIDYSEDCHLPSPLQLRYRILVKNKKLTASMPEALPMPIGTTTSASLPPVIGRHGSSSHTPIRWAGSTASKQPSSGRASSIVSNTSGGSVNNDDFSDDDEDDDDDDDENLDGK